MSSQQEFEERIALLVEEMDREVVNVTGEADKLLAVRAAQVVQVPSVRFIFDNGRLDGEDHEVFDEIAHRAATLAGAYGSALSNVVSGVRHEDRPRAIAELAQAVVAGITGGIDFIDSDDESPMSLKDLGLFTKKSKLN